MRRSNNTFHYFKYTQATSKNARDCIYVSLLVAAFIQLCVFHISAFIPYSNPFYRWPFQLKVAITLSPSTDTNYYFSMCLSVTDSTSVNTFNITFILNICVNKSDSVLLKICMIVSHCQKWSSNDYHVSFWVGAAASCLICVKRLNHRSSQSVLLFRSNMTNNIR